MINLQLPGGNRAIWVQVGLHRPAVFGPLYLENLLEAPNVQVRWPGDYIENPFSSGFHGEKTVDHWNTNGYLAYTPDSDLFKSVPTNFNPDSIEAKLFTSPSSMYPAFPALTFPAGHLRPGYVNQVYDSVNYGNFFYYCKGNGGASFEVYSIRCLRSGLVIQSSHYTYTYSSLSGSQITWSIRERTRTGGFSESFLNVKPSPSEIMACTSGNPLTQTTPTVTGTVYWGRYYPNLIVPSVVEGLLSMLEDHYILSTGNLPPVEEEHYGVLAMRATDKVNSNHVNMIEFLRDLRHPLEMFPKLKNLKNLGSISSDYLAVHYGLLPTIDDLRKIWDSAKSRVVHTDKSGYAIYRSSHSSESQNIDFCRSVVQRIKVAVENEDEGFKSLLNRLDDLGSLPKTENLWDLIPYSFLVDWFVDVGGLLERVDAYNRIMRLRIPYVTMSRKETIDATFRVASGFPYHGQISRVHYQRWVSDQCPVPPASVSFGDLLSNHWLEAGALLLQRKRHAKA